MTIEEAERLIDGLIEKELYALNEFLKSIERERKNKHPTDQIT